MKVQLLPSSIEPNGGASARQHLSCFVIDDLVAFDAGSLAFSCTPVQREQIRDIVISHVHLDHIAGLPLFIDDLFSTLTSPVRVYATQEMVNALERDVFNWTIYPRFSELKNATGPVLEYMTFKLGESFNVKHLTVNPIEVNHVQPSAGMIISDDTVSIGLTGDTANTDIIWERLNQAPDLSALLVECAFPDEMAELAEASHHLTPAKLAVELDKFFKEDVPIFVINIKPMFRAKVIEQIERLALRNVDILEVGRVYEF
jgi:ribonuclease BN (tRNA processing enzyme)